MCFPIEEMDKNQRTTGIAHRPNAYRVLMSEVEKYDDGIYGLDAETGRWVKVQPQWFTEIPAEESPELSEALQDHYPANTLPSLESYQDLDRDVVLQQSNNN
ncbi:MAG: hypothetical protein BRC33_06735 [Cyanobacteria bacterium SW_9_44_58]|nr:MAG: hypothetical protein BRC33_06735 [Cyanobacteria bacterium SW_9_44_58]